MDPARVPPDATPAAARWRRRDLLAAAGAAPAVLLAGCATGAGGEAAGHHAHRARRSSGGAAGRTVHTVDLVAAPASVPLRGAAQPPVAVRAYGGDVPGPTIRVPQGGRLQVEFHNRLPVETTVHWHGVRLPHAMDGVPHLTQPPVPPGGRFTYAFDLPDAGTFWYHSHLQGAEQVERGLHGLLVVEEPAPMAVDRELVWLLDDWRLGRDGQVAGNFLHPHDLSHAGRLGNVVTVNGRLPQAVPVRRGERLRLRLVNAANARIVGLRFDGHATLVVALDGQPVTPHAPPQDTVVLGPGMRADLVLEATGAPGSRHAVGDVFYPRAAYDLLEFVYDTEPLRTPRGLDGLALAPNPLAQPVLAGAATHELRFEGGMRGTMHSALLDGRRVEFGPLLRAGKAWAVNGVVAASHGSAGAHGGHGNGHGEPLLTLARGATVRLVLRNDTRWHHPIHLHGHVFRLLRVDDRPAPHQPWLDTVLLAPGEVAEVALVADNPGDWMLHCHVLEHHEAGMMGVVRVA